MQILKVRIPKSLILNAVFLTTLAPHCKTWAAAPNLENTPQVPAKESEVPAGEASKTDQLNISAYIDTMSTILTLEQQIADERGNSRIKKQLTDEVNSLFLIALQDALRINAQIQEYLQGPNRAQSIAVDFHSYFTELGTTSNDGYPKLRRQVFLRALRGKQPWIKPSSLDPHLVRRDAKSSAPRAATLAALGLAFSAHRRENSSAGKFANSIKKVWDSIENNKAFEKLGFEDPQAHEVAAQMKSIFNGAENAYRQATKSNYLPRLEFVEDITLLSPADKARLSPLQKAFAEIQLPEVDAALAQIQDDPTYESYIALTQQLHDLEHRMSNLNPDVDFAEYLKAEAMANGIIKAMEQIAKQANPVTGKMLSGNFSKMARARLVFRNENKQLLQQFRRNHSITPRLAQALLYGFQVSRPSEATLAAKRIASEKKAFSELLTLIPKDIQESPVVSQEIQERLQALDRLVGAPLILPKVRVNYTDPVGEVEAESQRSPREKRQVPPGPPQNFLPVDWHKREFLDTIKNSVAAKSFEVLAQLRSGLPQDATNAALLDHLKDVEPQDFGLLLALLDTLRQRQTELLVPGAPPVPVSQIPDESKELLHLLNKWVAAWTEGGARIPSWELANSILMSDTSQRTSRYALQRLLSLANQTKDPALISAATQVLSLLLRRQSERFLTLKRSLKEKLRAILANPEHSQFFSQEMLKELEQIYLRLGGSTSQLADAQQHFQAKTNPKVAKDAVTPPLAPPHAHVDMSEKALHWTLDSVFGKMAQELPPQLVSEATKTLVSHSVRSGFRDSSVLMKLIEITKDNLAPDADRLLAGHLLLHNVDQIKALYGRDPALAYTLSSELESSMKALYDRSVELAKTPSSGGASVSFSGLLSNAIAVRTGMQSHKDTVVNLASLPKEQGGCAALMNMLNTKGASRFY